MVSNAQDAIAALLACGIEDDFAQDLITQESDYDKVCNDPLNYLGDQWMEINAAFVPANDVHQLEAAMIALHFRPDVAKSYSRTLINTQGHIRLREPFNWAMMFANGLYKYGSADLA